MQADKRNVFKVVFLSFVASNQWALTPAVIQFFLSMFPMSSSCFGMIADKGGGRHGHQVCVRSVVGIVASRSLS
jgi:hypothetical protein